MNTSNGISAAAAIVLTIYATPSVTHGAADTSDQRGSYLILYAADLRPAADAWAAYRASQGWQVVISPVEPADDEARAAMALRDLIRKHYLSWRDHVVAAAAASAPAAPAQAAGEAEPSAPATSGEFDVLLLGDVGTPGHAGIPTWHFAQTEPTIRDKDGVYASDDPYQLMDDADAAPDIQLGRVPARTVDEAALVLDKIRRYESNDAPGAWRRRIVYAAGEGHFGVFDAMFENMFKQMVDRFVPDVFDVSVTYAKASSIYCPPPSTLSDCILDRMREGALLFNYVGHGHATGFDSLFWAGKRVRILTSADLERLGGARADLPIALLTCCSTGWYDLPDGQRSMAEAMLFHPAGPVAVIAGSRQTHPYANAVHQRHVTQMLLSGRFDTVGALDLASTRALLAPDEIDRQLDAVVQPIALGMKWQTSLADLRLMHVELYNLLGDPATRIARPGATIEGLAVSGTRITGTVRGLASGKVTIRVETAVTTEARPQDMLPVIGTDDPELEAKAKHNYPLANDRMLGRVEVEIVDGRFDAVIEAIDSPAAAVVKAYAVGKDAQGRAEDAFGALRLPNAAGTVQTN